MITDFSRDKILAKWVITYADGSTYEDYCDCDENNPVIMANRLFDGRMPKGETTIEIIDAKTNELIVLFL